MKSIVLNIIRELGGRDVRQQSIFETAYRQGIHPQDCYDEIEILLRAGRIERKGENSPLGKSTRKYTIVK